MNDNAPRASSLLPASAAALLLLASPAPAADPADTHPGLNLIPWPKVVRPGGGRMPLSAAARVVAGDDALKPLAEILSGEIALLTGLKLGTAAGASRPGDIVLRVNKTLRSGEPILGLRGGGPTRTRDGAHKIDVTDRAAVEGFDYRAVAEGTATLLQAVGRSGGKVSLPRLSVEDWPHADYCGMLVDVARQDHPVEWLEKMVRVCRFYKVRYLHLHLTDDQGWTFPSTKYPQLGSKNYGAHGGVAPKVYGLKGLKALVAYADARGVTLVPEMEVPGHSGAALRSVPEVFDAIDPVTKRPVHMGCMNMSNEAIYPVLDTIIGEMCEVFKSSPYFHIGSDEVSMGRVPLHPGYRAFMARHGLKDDHALADHFIARVNGMVKKRGKKAIKWEGLADEASKDIVIMAWDKNNRTAGRMIAKGYAVITCPWDLGVPWEDWSMYVCNGSQLKKGDPVLGATLVAWEQPPATHLAGVRNVAGRQERTWGPDNKVTVEGFAARFQALDAAVGRLLAMPPGPVLKATFASTAGTRDWMAPELAFDGNDATFHTQDAALLAGGHFTVTLERPTPVHAVEVLTGINGKGLLDGGEVQASADGEKFHTVATLAKGSARAVLKENNVRAVRLLARSKQAEPLVVREIRLRLMVETSGVVKGPASAIGEGNVAVLKGDTTFAPPLDGCATPVRNRGFTLTLDGGGYAGPITGEGKVEVRAGRGGAALTGKDANTMSGSWLVKGGRLTLAKEPGVRAMGGKVTVAEDACLAWGNTGQAEPSTAVRLLGSGKAGACLDLNGFSVAVAALTTDAGAAVLTDGAAGVGVLTVGSLVVDGKAVARGVHTSSSGWVRGGGYVLVGGAKAVKLAGAVADLEKAVGPGNIAALSAASRVRLPAESAIPVDTGAFPLTLVSDGAARYAGFVTGRGALLIEAGRLPLEIAGASPNAHRGPTVLVRGVLKLNKPGGIAAVPGDLTLGGSGPENEGDGVIWGADGQLSASSSVTLAGTRQSFLDLAGHKARVAKVTMSKAGKIRTGAGGSLAARQLHVDGKRVKDGTYKAPLPWLEGSGTVTVDARVEVRGSVGDCDARIGRGNVADLTGDTTFAYPVSDCHPDVITNGHTVTFDTGNGNAFSVSGVVAGEGDVVFLSGPSYTGHRDAPLRLTGDRPNTATGRFLVRKGRVTMEKPEGVDAISGDVTVGGQGFNDCLFWVRGDQIKDTANITLIGAGPNGAAYLHLNGNSETAASLTMAAGNTVKTDGAGGRAGVLTVKALTVGGVKKPAGVYTAATEKWIEGKGKVVVRP